MCCCLLLITVAQIFVEALLSAANSCGSEYMCEGFDHPSAEPLDRWYAAQQLQKSTQHTMALEAAKPVGWDAQQELYDGGSSNSSSVGGL